MRGGRVSRCARAALAAALGGLALLPFAATAATATVGVGPGRTYTPQDRYIAVGSTIEWFYDDPNNESHTVTSDPSSSEQFDSSPNNCPQPDVLGQSDCMSPSNPTYRHLFARVGDFNYYCRIHTAAVMHGTIHVRPKPTDTESATPSPTPTKTKSASPSPTATGSATATGSPTGSASPTETASPTESPSPAPAPGGGGNGGKVALAIGGIVALTGAGFFVYRRFIAAQ